MPYNITYMWNLKYDTNKHIYETERDLWLTRGREDEGEINREFGVSRRKLLYRKQIFKKKVFLLSTGYYNKNTL